MQPRSPGRALGSLRAVLLDGAESGGAFLEASAAAGRPGPAARPAPPPAGPAERGAAGGEARPGVGPARGPAVAVGSVRGPQQRVNCWSCRRPGTVTSTDAFQPAVRWSGHPYARERTGISVPVVFSLGSWISKS